MDIKTILKVVEKENPFEYGTEQMSGSKTQRNNRRKRNQGYLTALEVMERVLSSEDNRTLSASLQFIEDAYGIKHTVVNTYHVKLYHDEYRGWFDWYHTTGTLIANRDGGATNMGKIKNDEDVAQIINKHIYGERIIS